MTAVQVDSKIERISPHFTREWLDNDRLVVYHLAAQTLTHHDIDLYVDTVIQTMQNWNPRYPYLALQVLNDIELGNLRAYTFQRADDIFDHVDNTMAGRIATVVRKNPLLQMTRRWLERNAYTNQPNIKHQIFFERSPAYNWLVKTS